MLGSFEKIVIDNGIKALKPEAHLKIAEWILAKERIILPEIKKINYQSEMDDRLLEGIMIIFDTLQPSRFVVQRLMIDLWTEPSLALALHPYIFSSSERFLNAIGFSLKGIQKDIMIYSFILMMLYLLKIWLKDNTQDQSETLSKAHQKIHLFMSAYQKMGSVISF